MVAALIVKEDGLIYAAEVPEWPNYVEDNHLWNHNLEMRYEVALTSAKESALLCADQEKANKLLIGVGVLFNTATLKPKPGIYPIPDLQWEVKRTKKCNPAWGSCEKESGHKGSHAQFPKFSPKQVAILKESTPSEPKIKPAILLNQIESLKEENRILKELNGGKLLAYDQMKEMLEQYAIRIKELEEKEFTPSTEEESQEELWKAVSNEINDEGLWLYDDYVGFTINAKGFAYLMKQFTITRKP